MKFYSIEPQAGENAQILYDRKSPPNNSVSKTWTTRGVATDGAEITFVEYEYYDKDPDGVREAYGCLYDSEHTLTANTDKADPEKLFVYTVQGDGEILYGMDFNIEDAQAIYVLTAPKGISDEALLRLTEELVAKPLSYTEAETLILHRLLADTPKATLVVLP